MCILMIFSWRIFIREDILSKISQTMESTLFTSADQEEFVAHHLLDGLLGTCILEQDTLKYLQI